MTDLKAKAMKIIEQIPEERMNYVLKELEYLNERFDPAKKEDRKLRAQEAWAKIHEIMAPHRDKFPKDIDYKKEMQEYRDERYGIA